MLSIVIITKNEEKTLPRLLASINSQGIENYEIIVADACSIDKTRTIARSNSCKVVEGGIPSVGRNNGAKAAKGDLLLFLDSDTFLTGGFLRHNLHEFKQRNLDAASCLTSPMSKKMIDKLLFKIYQRFALMAQYFSPNGTGCCIFCKKELFERIKGFNEDLVLLEEHDFVKKCSKNGKFRILRSRPIYIDMRRFEKEGRFKVSLKYSVMGLFALFNKKLPKMFDYDMQGVNVTCRKTKVFLMFTFP